MASIKFHFRTKAPFLQSDTAFPQHRNGSFPLKQQTVDTSERHVYLKVQFEWMAMGLGSSRGLWGNGTNTKPKACVPYRAILFRIINSMWMYGNVYVWIDLHDSFCCFLTWNVSSDRNCIIDKACSLCFPLFLRGSEGLLVYCVNILWLLMQHWMVAKLYSHYQSWIRKGVVAWGVPFQFLMLLILFSIACSWM